MASRRPCNAPLRRFYFGCPDFPYGLADEFDGVIGAIGAGIAAAGVALFTALRWCTTWCTLRP